jgi:hypothetical protein
MYRGLIFRGLLFRRIMFRGSMFVHGGQGERLVPIYTRGSVSHSHWGQGECLVPPQKLGSIHLSHQVPPSAHEMRHRLDWVSNLDSTWERLG